MTARKSDFSFSRRFMIWGMLLLMMSGSAACGLVESLSGGKKDQLSTTRAFFVREQEANVRRDERMVRITGSVQQTTRIIQETIRETTSSASNVMRLPASGVEAYMGLTPILRITTPYIKVDTLDAFKEMYHLGSYIIDDPEYKVQADELGFSIEANVYVSGQDLIVRFQTNPMMEWNVYKRRGAAELDNWVKLPEKQRARYGVGKYSFEREGVQYTRLGRSQSVNEIITVSVDDQPRTKGVMEERLIDKLVEMVAVTSMSASIIRR